VCEDESVEERAPVRFCTLADARYFPGLVALVNSLRLQGHREPITVLDLGLTPEQRRALSAECDVVPPPSAATRHPWLLEPRACMVRSADIVVYIDADVIVTAPLDELIESARNGRIAVVADERVDRWFAEWESVFGLSAPPRRQTYINAGFVAVSTTRFPELLARWVACCERIVSWPTILDGVDPLSSPAALSSQDALNALLMSEVGHEAIDLQPTWAQAQGTSELSRTRVVDVHTLSCRFDNHPTTMLHSWGTRKPWHRDAARDMHRTAYLVCLRRLLTQPEVAVPIRASEVPIWLRPGPVATAVLWSLIALRRPARRTVALLRRVQRRVRRDRSPAQPTTTRRDQLDASDSGARKR
jgi:hypothetical protein